MRREQQEVEGKGGGVEGGGKRGRREITKGGGRGGRRERRSNCIFTTLPDSAEAGLDFVAAIPDLTLTTLQPLACVNVSIAADSVLEGREQFTIEITTSMPRVTVTAASITIVIEGEFTN